LHTDPGESCSVAVDLPIVAMQERFKEINSLIPRPAHIPFKLGPGLIAKACPRCREVYEKEDDAQCDHMKCSNCELEFCWTCLSDRAVIEAHGNHYHTPRCKFWFPPPTKEPAVQFLERCSTCRKTRRPCKPPTKESRVPVPPVPLTDKEAWDLQLRRQERKNQKRAPVSGTTLTWNGTSTKATCSQCKVCLSNFEVGDDVRQLDCNHSFHVACIDEWFKHGGGCPTCKLRKAAAAGA